MPVVFDTIKCSFVNFGQNEVSNYISTFMLINKCDFTVKLFKLILFKLVFFSLVLSVNIVDPNYINAQGIQKSIKYSKHKMDLAITCIYVDRCICDNISAQKVEHKWIMVFFVKTKHLHVFYNRKLLNLIFLIIRRQMYFKVGDKLINCLLQDVLFIYVHNVKQIWIVIHYFIINIWIRIMEKMKTLIQNNNWHLRRRGVSTMYIIVLTCLTIFLNAKQSKDIGYIYICVLRKCWVIQNYQKASLWYVDLNVPFLETAVIVRGKCKDKTQYYSKKARILNCRPKNVHFLWACCI